MRRLLLPLAAALGALALLAPTASGRVHITLRYLAKQTSSHFRDVAPKGKQNPGDSFDFTENLFVAAGVAGSDRVHCTLLARPHTFCRARVFFREGTISVRGRLSDQRVNRLAVTGGTGLFRGQRGSLETRNASQTTTLLRFDLR